jgi:hypothetical protein
VDVRGDGRGGAVALRLQDDILAVVNVAGGEGVAGLADL